MDSNKSKSPSLEKNFEYYHSSFKEFEKFDQNQPKEIYFIETKFLNLETINSLKRLNLEGFRHETTNKGILVKMLVSVLKTNQLVLKNYMVDDVSEQTYYNETLGFNCPEWRKWCR